MRDNQGVQFNAEQSYHIQRPIASPFLNINTHKNIKIHEPYPTGKYINVVNPHKNTGKLTINPQFQQFLSFDNTNPNSVIVSFMGPRKIGKSFVIDNLLSLENGEIRRIMCKNKQQLVNSPSLVSTNLQGDRIIYLDSNGQPCPSIFLWLYFLSSVIVYNMSPANQNEQQTLIQCLVYCHNKIQSLNKQLSKPQLILVRRDVGNKQIYDFDLIRKIQQFEMFLPNNILIIHLPYPGNRNVMAKQILDVPARQLDPIFLNEIKKLHHLIRQSKAKSMEGNLITPQTLNIMLQPLTKAINNEQEINQKKMQKYKKYYRWNQVYQSLSIGYYNNYLKLYCQQLQKQFESEQPCDKYSLYKKLSKIRRRINKKMQRYNIISNQPIFIKYMQKLNETIRSKQQLMKEVNSAKSRQFHNKNFNQLFSKLNQNNFQQLIDKYCQSNLDDQKTQVLLQNIDKVIANKNNFDNINSLSTAPLIKPYQPSQQLISLKKNIEQLDTIIINKSKIPPPQPQNLQIYKSAIQNKKLHLSTIKQEIEKLANAPQSANNGQNSQLMDELQQQKQKLKKDIQKQQKEINFIKQSKIKQAKAKLEEEYRKQEQALQKLKNTNPQSQYRPHRIVQAGKATKKTCCSLM